MTSKTRIVPDGTDPQPALARTTHLCISAHQDDIEIMAYHGIAQCFAQKDKWFSGVVVTNGAGSPRTGIYADYTDREMHGRRSRPDFISRGPRTIGSRSLAGQ